ncbi:MAG: UTP--glucose-1-phosphate uridylyltransferase [Candidatus Kerfeldbacteria bacterium]|nr:UTP--glucose-1-phosphate uridylyltransferase [Candidatus Kerfeldbacteria bacterium]
MYHIDNAAIQAKLRARGIDPDHIKALHVKLQTGELDHSSFVIDASRLRPPQPNEFPHYQQLHHAELQQQGITALRQDQLLVFWLNGGAATRYFDHSKITAAEQQRYHSVLQTVADDMVSSPKGITPVVNGLSYLELKIRNLLHHTAQYHLSHHPHVIIMNSFITDAATRKHVQQLLRKYPTLEPDRFHFVVQQPLIPRFQKVMDLKNIDLFIDQTGELSWAPCGHGDFIYLLQHYLRETHIPQVQYMFFANIDNLGATLDPVLLGAHIQTGRGRTVELATKTLGDQGGAPCYVDGQLIIVEQMKFPSDFDQDQIPFFNTNTFWFTLNDLLAFEEDLPLVLAEKTLPEGEVIQLEHFACDVNLPSHYVIVPRERRFWPVKRFVDALIYQDQTIAGKKQHDFQALLRTDYGL